MNIKKLLTAILATTLTISAYAIDYEEWMKTLPDNMHLCNLSIPGSHDSGTKDFTFNGETQKLTIAEQLSAGVRAFDLRPGVYDENTLYLYHSSFLHGNETLEEVFNTLTTFLTNHPSECVFACIKEESGDDTQWKSLVSQCLQKYESYLLSFTHELTLGEMRGKILLMSRDKYASIPYGTYFASGWKDNATSTNSIKGNSTYSMTVRIQDIYNIPESSLEQKKTDITTLMTECGKGNTHKLYINHTSGYTQLYFFSHMYIAECAQECNKVVTDYLTDYKGPVGLIMSDFVGKDEIDSYNTLGQKLIDAVIINCQNTAADIYTGIETIASQDMPEKIYDLSGRELNQKPTVRGIYIRGNKKYAVK